MTVLDKLALLVHDFGGVVEGFRGIAVALEVDGPSGGSVVATAAFSATNKDAPKTIAALRALDAVACNGECRNEPKVIGAVQGDAEGKPVITHYPKERGQA